MADPILGFTRIPVNHIRESKDGNLRYLQQVREAIDDAQNDYLGNPSITMRECISRRLKDLL